MSDWNENYIVEQSDLCSWWIWSHVDYDGPEDERCGVCKTEQEAWDAAYENACDAVVA